MPRKRAWLSMMNPMHKNVGGSFLPQGLLINDLFIELDAHEQELSFFQMFL